MGNKVYESDDITTAGMVMVIPSESISMSLRLKVRMVLVTRRKVLLAY
jgi:hypothetical protein